MQRKGTHLLIHGFALLHVAVTMLCTSLGIQDSLLLTALTMTLAMFLCFRENLTVEITVCVLILVNILGFVLGNVGAQALIEFMPPLWQHAISTFVVTELLGWSLYAFAHNLSPGGAAGYEREQSWYRHAAPLVISIAVVFGIRVYIDSHYSGNFLLENSGATGLLILTTGVSLLFMVQFALQMQREASAQRTRRHQAEFRYMTLKHQVNPHFLFNSLNVLDSIVQEGTREQASDYIQEMATLYRYIMKQEDQQLVPLSEEIDFAKTYWNLMKIRHQSGLVIEDLVGEDYPSGYTVPYTLQLLLENAIKHNAISADNPLKVTFSTDGTSLTLRNNIIPKVTPVRSTGIGLQYIRNQFRDIAGAEIQVLKTDDSFSVTIPIIPEFIQQKPQL